MDWLEQAGSQMHEILREFQDLCSFRLGNLMVVGCSTSEIAGQTIGSSSNWEVAQVIFPILHEWARKQGLYLAVQGCEHINRCLVVEEECMGVYGLEPVCVVPHLKAGGAFCTYAFQNMPGAVMVESLLHQANGGMDIGNTLIGMHLRRVAVPVRLTQRRLGQAQVNCAKTRPLYVGGERARYY